MTTTPATTNPMASVLPTAPTPTTIPGGGIGTTTTSSTSTSSANANNITTPLYERLVSEEVREMREYIRLVEQQSQRLIELERIYIDLESRLETEHSKSCYLEHTLTQQEIKWKSIVTNLLQEKEKSEKLVQEEKMKVDKLMEMVNRLQTEIHTLIKSKFSNPHHPPSQQQQQQRIQQHHPPPSPHHHRINNRPSSPIPFDYQPQQQQHHHINGSSNPTITKSPSSSQPPPLSSSLSHPPMIGITSSGSSGGGGSGEKNTHRHRSQQQQQVQYQQTQNNNYHHIGPHEILANNGSAAAVRERNALGSLLDFFGM